MATRIHYQPHCPAQDCNGGDAAKLRPVAEPSNVQLTDEALLRKKNGMSIWRCLHCGLVWFQSNVSRPGFEPTPGGFYNSFIKPGEFFIVPLSYPIRSENQSWYWQQQKEKRKKRRR